MILRWKLWLVAHLLFQIESHDECIYDYLEIRDGYDKSAPLIGQYCGYRLPADVQSTGSELYVKFKSDGSVQKTGFSAVFTKGN